MRRRFAIATALALPACAMIPESKPPFGIEQSPEPSYDSALAAGVMAGPSVASLGLQPGDANAALAAFVASCSWLTTKDDRSGLTVPADWQAPCGVARNWPSTRGAEFFALQFETAVVADGKAFATGYYEPEIAGSRTRLPGYDVPVYRVPDDLVRAWPEGTAEHEKTGRAPLGRYDASGKFVPYYTRAEIEDGALAGKGLEIAWAKDSIEMFFLQIQGSGLLRQPDGSVMRIGYNGQNGHGYTGIGGVMRERGLLGDGPGQYPGSMQGIVQYLRDFPEEGRQLMRLNESWIFFRELTTDGPLGSLGIPVRRGDSVAVDPRFVPYGAPVWLDLDRNVADGLWIAQDTGGAIKGANRFDTFWGNGGDSAEIAGGMSGRGQALVLLPKGVVARLQASSSQ
ncbi:murein transglycosylase A [Erythrobacter sp. SDW2]|uniref:murein transglycosylase A n=1 Tax=Erythrobacter sp. SDW2 TaxID=2907154 RepID=UPI001F4190F7|nr:murein transglycosylase A [Erythrobacter sp. SDW2]UIP06802.1 murein transglycosylase A [Erythrobacter sp. SDW2]